MNRTFMFLAIMWPVVASADPIDCQYFIKDNKGAWIEKSMAPSFYVSQNWPSVTLHGARLEPGQLYLDGFDLWVTINDKCGQFSGREDRYEGFRKGMTDLFTQN